MLAIYTRLSREDEESTSIENQIREGKEFAKENNYNQYKVYNEGEGVSGAWEIEKRPQLDQLIQDIKKKKFTAVWFRNQNRLGRNEKTYIIFVDVCLKTSTKVYFDGKEFDFTDPSESLTGSILSALNSYTIKLQSKQTKKALLDNVKAGKAHSVIAYGYTTDDDGYLVIDENEAKIVKRMFTDHAKGKGCNKIAEELTNEGIPTRYSKLKNQTLGKWHDKTVRDIIRNTIYYGKRVWGKNTYDCPAIIDKKLFDQNEKAFKTNQNGRGKKVEHKYLLNGLLKCGVCGRNMNGRSRKDKSDHYYRCTAKRLKGDEKCHNRSINIDAMEEFVWNRFFVQRSFIRIVEDLVNKSQNKAEQQRLADGIFKLDVQMGKLKKEKDNAIRLAIKGLVSDEDIQRQIKLIDAKRKDLDDRCEAISEEFDFITSAIEKEKTITKDLKGLKNNTPFNTKREIIHKYIKHINITSVEYEHVIFIQFDLPGMEEEVYVRYKGEFYSFNDLPDGVEEVVDVEGINYFQG